jgi:hypothetical protein
MLTKNERQHDTQPNASYRSPDIGVHVVEEGSEGEGAVTGEGVHLAIEC